MRALLPLLALFPACAATMPRGPVELELDLSLRVPRLSVMVNGRGPYLFLIDTGAPFVSVTSRLAAELGGLSGGDPRLASIRAGGFELFDTPVVIRDDAPNYDTDGVLGFSAFQGCVACFDFPNARLRISSEAPAGPRWLTDEGPRTQPIVPLYFALEGGEAWRVPLLIDTGNDGGIFLPTNRDALPFPNAKLGDAEVLTARGVLHWEFVQLETRVRLGEFEFVRPVVAVPSPGARGFSGELALVGMRLLERYRLTFDPRNARILFEPANSADEHLVPARPAPHTARR